VATTLQTNTQAEEKQERTNRFNPAPSSIFVLGFRRKMEELERWLADAVGSAVEYPVCVTQLRLPFFQLPSAINTSNNRTMWARHWPSFIARSRRQFYDFCTKHLCCVYVLGRLDILGQHVGQVAAHAH